MDLLIPGKAERLIAKLFADDTTVYLSQDDNYNDLTKILKTWCRASGAKFNMHKTVLIPVGSSNYRENLFTTRKLNPTLPSIPNEVLILPEGTATRVLGAFVGNNVNEINVWEPTIEKIANQLGKWNRSNPTQDSQRLIIGMEVGGRTQYLTRVQGMPGSVLKRLTKITQNFVWNGEKPMIKADTLQSNILEGGKKILNIHARNDAIELMKCKTYLNFGKDRPEWALIADRLIANCITDTQKIDRSSAVNIFLQTWTVNTNKKSKLPASLLSMLQVAKAYGITIDPPLPHPDLAKVMPIWHHTGTDPAKRSRNNYYWARCHRETHKISTVGDMYNYVYKTPPQHLLCKNCACQACRHARQLGCTNPKLCRMEGRRILDTLLEKWLPLDHEAQHAELLEDEDNSRLFNPCIQSSHELTLEFRVFADKHHGDYRPAKIIPTAPGPNDDPHMTAYISSATMSDDQADARAAGSVYYGNNNARNIGIPSASNPQDHLGAQMQALLQVLLDAAPTTNVKVITESSKLINILTLKLEENEDNAWESTPHKPLFMSAVSEMRKRQGTTSFILNLNHQLECEPLNKAKDLALQTLREEVDEPIPDELELRPTRFNQRGAKLATMTQKKLYRMIMARRQVKDRAATMESMDTIRAAVYELSKEHPTDQSIFTSIRRREHPTKIKNFLYKIIHNAYKCGKYWRHIPGYEERAECHVCNTEDSMMHILTECRASGQDKIWKLAEELWERRGLPWVTPTIGLILGSNTINFRNPKGKVLRGANRLYAILITESAYLIWKLRCEWKIQNEEDPEKIPSEDQIHRQWSYTINKRFRMECLMTNKYRYGSKALNTDLIERTWWPVILDRESFPDDWIYKTVFFSEYGGRTS